MTPCYIRIKGDILVGTAPSLASMSTWVLLEREDWFENEINFLRRFLRPGMNAIDVGANVGVYALTMAKRVSPGGSVHAYEPAGETVALLESSVRRNGLTNIGVIAAALSAAEGRRALYNFGNPETNSFRLHTPDGQRGTEEVAVLTLDGEQRVRNWGIIDFIKLDAEGEEASILAGGRDFFVQQSPLVMFEAVSVTGGPADTALQAAFRAMGYALYRLIGPDLILVPFEPGEALRPFDLNLFACKPDRARQLASAGLLVTQAAPLPEIKDGSGTALIERQAYAAAFGTLNPRSDRYRSALDSYARWRDAAVNAELRYAALCAALRHARDAVREIASPERLSSLARIAVEAGERQVAIDALLRAVTLLRQNAAPPTEPFLPATPRYDAIDPGNAPLPWLIAASVEALEELRVFSGFFLPVEAQRPDILDWLQSTPFASAPIERRRQLQNLRAGRQARMTAPTLLQREAPANLNPALWIEGAIGPA